MNEVLEAQHNYRLMIFAIRVESRLRKLLQLPAHVIFDGLNLTYDYKQHNCDTWG